MIVLFMIRFSSVVPFLGLRYHKVSLDAGAQTTRSGLAGPVSFLHGRAALAGCFLHFLTCLRSSIDADITFIAVLFLD